MILFFTVNAGSAPCFRPEAPRPVLHIPRMRLSPAVPSLHRFLHILILFCASVSYKMYNMIKMKTYLINRSAYYAFAILPDFHPNVKMIAIYKTPLQFVLQFAKYS